MFESSFLNPSSLPSQPSQFLHHTKLTLISSPNDLPQGCPPNIRLKPHPTKNMLQYKRQRYYTLSNVERIEEQESQRETGEMEIGIGSVEMTKREKYQIEMREVNKNYSEFMREFKKTKPLYQVKEQLFKETEKVRFELKREEVLRKLREHYKPIPFEQIDQHQKIYLRNRPSFGSKRERYQQKLQPIGQLKESPKLRHHRGKSSTISVQSTKSIIEQSRQHHSLSKMRDHYDRIINRSRRDTAQSQSLRRKYSARIEPSSQRHSPNTKEGSRPIQFESPESLGEERSTLEKSPKNRGNMGQRLFKLTMNQVESKEIMGERENNNYHLARFGAERQLCEENEFCQREDIIV